MEHQLSHNGAQIFLVGDILQPSPSCTPQFVPVKFRSGAFEDFLLGLF